MPASVLSCTSEVDQHAFAGIRARLTLDHAKWDPRIGDSETLARFAIITSAEEWRRLAGLAEVLAAEALQAESDLLTNPEAIGRLGLPRAIAAAFRQVAAGRVRPTPAAARVVRFDFHPTPDGWRISEANADVPGGYAESSEFPALMAEHFSEAAPIGRPGDALATAILAAAGDGARIALVSAPGYLEDLQVISYLADRHRILGADARILQPVHLRWRDGRAEVSGEPIDAVVRFHQGEWFASRPRRADWRPYFVGGTTPTCNPGTALLAESQRFPLAWPALHAPMTTWRALLPETVAPRERPDGEGDGWVLKRAFCNTGDAVAWPGSAGESTWRAALWAARLRPSDWVAQRRFETIPIETPIGPMYPCLGVYVIDGRAEGVYGRLGRGPIIDYRATDVAVLVRNDYRGSPP